MERELFKETYNNIKLNAEQKERIWNALAVDERRENVGIRKKFPVSSLVAACICVILVIGVPVLAANTSFIQDIGRAFGLLTKEEHLTDGQRDVYGKYGENLDIKIPMKDGILKMNAVISDGYYTCIPFSFILKDKIKAEDGKLNDGLLSYILDKVSEFDFYTENNRGEDIFMGRYTVLDEKMYDDRTITGVYLMYEDENQLKKGDIIRLKEGEWGGAAEDKKVVGELTVPSPMKRRDISADSVKRKLLKGMSVDEISFSPIALRITGVEQLGEAEQSVRNSKISLELKDGSIINEADTGSHSTGDADKNGNISYDKTAFWGIPVEFEDVKAIHIKNYALDLTIPVTD